MTGALLSAVALGAGASWGGGAATAGLPAVPAVVIFDFDPVGTILGIAVRWQIVAVAATILGALLLAAAIALAADRRRAAALAADPERAVAVAEAVEAALQTVRGSEADASPVEAGAAGAARPTEPPAPSPVPQDRPPLVDRPWLVSLRLDDLLFIAIAGAAGAVVGGRLGHALLYLDVYRLDPAAILDPSRGSLTLAGGVALGILTGLLVATILGAPVRRWLGVAVVPLLLALCLGKLAMILGGAGQGVPTDAGWATAYAGPGPWGSLAPEIPSVPAQAIEAATSAAALVVVLLLALLRPLRRHAAILFAVGLGLWAIGRFAVAFTWRDPVLVGPLDGDQLVTAGIAAAAAASLIGATISLRRGGATSTVSAAVAPGAGEPGAVAVRVPSVAAEPAHVDGGPPSTGVEPAEPDVSASPGVAPGAGTLPPSPGWPPGSSYRHQGD